MTSEFVTCDNKSFDAHKKAAATPKGVGLAHRENPVALFGASRTPPCEAGRYGGREEKCVNIRSRGE